MLRINCVLVNGKLVGKTVSDRWNLDTITYGSQEAHSKSGIRALAKMADCCIVVHKADQTITAKPSKLERSALTRKLIKLFTFAA